jgi:hypothetical protein
MIYVGVAYLLLTLVTAVLVYASWLRRLHKRDVWGAQCWASFGFSSFR